MRFCVFFVNSVKKRLMDSIVDNRFYCEKLHANLSRELCVKRHTEGIFLTCRQCELGAIHSGYTLQDKPNLSNTCSRCKKSVGRLIYKKLCVSCYNRQRETVVGFDRRGNPPTITLGKCSVLCSSDKQTLKLSENKTNSVSELLIDVVRDKPDGFMVSKVINNELSINSGIQLPVYDFYSKTPPKTIIKQTHDFIISSPGFSFKETLSRALLGGQQVELFTHTACV